MMKTGIFLVTGALILVGCQDVNQTASLAAGASIGSTVIEATTAPAADNDAGLDFKVLPKDFPVLAEMKFSGVPSGCRLYKSAKADAAVDGGAASYVFTSQQSSSADGAPLYQVAVNGETRTLKQTYTKNYGTKMVRYLKTINQPVVDILVEIETVENAGSGVRHKGLVGRIKGWDEDLPLLCDYNRIRVEGDCDI